jgi:hypothetical protein
VPALLELQRLMRVQLLDTPGASTAGAQHDSPDELICIYRNTVTTTLVNALRLSFPAVQRIVGAEFFEAMAREFIREHAPDSAYLNEYGAALPGFLAGFGPAKSISYLAQVAQLEWAVNRALHAPDLAALDVQRLAALAEAALPGVCLKAHPGVTLLRLQFPADTIWRAVLDQDSDAMAAVDLSSGPIHLLIERNADGVQVRRLSILAWQFAAQLNAGMPLYAALSEASETASEDMNALLADHLASGRFIDFSWTGEMPS